ncbi:MAG: cyclic nucleotide-binding domain-containing protein, partial [Planctomycetales bacterium]|nr:cyclic nucleotide-binding domain-containing protein [Planctomycetales bacterium]
MRFRANQLEVSRLAMSVTDVKIQRPQRWDIPFGEEMTPANVGALLRIRPFCDMDPNRFPASCSLADLLLNDTRVNQYRSGDIIVREGDYGASAFLILQGSVRMFLESLPTRMLGRSERDRPGIFRSLAQLWSAARPPEVRHVVDGRTNGVGRRNQGTSPRIFLQDVPGVLDEYNNRVVATGEVFGEVAAMSRTPRSATVIAAEDCTLLEIRWQGLRDMMRRAPEWREHIETLYRQNSLETHLRETPVLEGVGVEQLHVIAAVTEFETYGDFEWQANFQAIQRSTPAERLGIEPVIAEEGQAPDGLILIRSGFARLSRRYGDGHRTIAYLGKGQVYGLEELVHQHETGEPAALRRTLRAVGYVDILRLPRDVVGEYVIPSLNPGHRNRLVRTYADPELATAPTPAVREKRRSRKSRTPALDTGMLEFIVENRFMNGAEAMLIDLERCTRCDDCVRACAATHNNNPRFTREGPTYGRYMFAQACMHCVDPVCMIGCPSGAIGREEQTGNVVINDSTCIGCATCADSCPYNNIRMVDIRDSDGNFIRDEETLLPIAKATKCDLCVDQWGGPACQRAC